MKELTITFNEKFTQNQLEEYINQYWKDSFSSTKIIFDLSKTEWVSSEEITFLFSWIRKLILENKNVKVDLPFTEKGLGDIDENSLKRKKLLKYYLLSIWGLFRTGLDPSDFDNIADFPSLVKQRERFNYGKRIIPFNVIDTNYDPINDTVDKNYNNIKSINNGLFSIEQEIIELLNNNDCYSPFENKIISDIISKELVINSMEHSGSKENEGYFTTALKDKWPTKSNKKYFIEHFTKEKSEDTLDFYKDKETIRKTINKEIKTFSVTKQKQLGNSYYPKLKSYNIFKNQSFIEFTFIDFGKGINATLKEEYKKIIICELIKIEKPKDENKLIEKLKLKELKELISILKEKKSDSALLKSLTKNVLKKHVDTQILEFAFLMESSKEPFDRKDNPYYQLIPRGLYFVIDMVRRYKGLLVARSGFGKVIYDFSNRIKIIKNSTGEFNTKTERIYIAKDSIVPNIIEGKTFFPGTMISIILPQRKTENLKKSSVRSDNFILNKAIFDRDNPNNIGDEDYFPSKLYEPESYEYLNLAFEYKVADTKISISKFNTKLGIDNIIFKAITQKLKSLSDKNCLLFIDFDFIPIKNNNNILKILLYLSNNPLVNERTKVVLLNLKDDDLIILKEYEQVDIGIEEGESVPFLFKPIPCINLVKTEEQLISVKNIQWIGVRKKEDIKILTDLFFGKIEPNVGVPIDRTYDNWLYEGNVITKHNDRAYSIFTDIQDLVKKALKAKTSQLENWLLNEIEDGDKPKNGKKKYFFLTSKGSYQKEYLSLYETLNYKYAAQYFAQYLLDKFINQNIAIYNKDKGIPYEDENLKNQKKILESIRFDKMIVVTVSSQLLGVQIRDLIKDNNAYKFLRKKNVKNPKLNDCPDIIKLSSYFSFDSEKPFEEIKPNTKILIVNDVISTGSLVNRLINGIIKKDASVSGILTIADSRKPDEDIDKNIEYSSCEFNEYEDKVVSILSYKRNKKFNLIKLIKRPKGKFPIKRINPILNSVVTLESKHTETTKILFDEPSHLISQEPFTNKNVFRIGHFVQNLTHNSYFTDMHNLFSNKNGENLLEIIHKRIDEISDKMKISNFEGIKNNLLKAKSDSKGIVSDVDKINQIENVYDDLINKLEILLPKDSLSKSYSPKFIFHPVFSGIEEVSDDVLHKIFKTDKANIISLQRYNTINGWRFPFPAKRFNNVTKGAHILIIDSGSLSGHSLTQLIDSISFLDVGRIDFLSIIGRIDDFQREFHSRLRSIKVKNLKLNSKTKKNDSIVNLNILFGINLHIPTFLSKDTCPYCKEINFYNSIIIKNDKSKFLPNEALEFINQRMKYEINRIDIGKKNDFPAYLPILKKNKKPDFNNIFLMRDRLGKVDSYRFYTDYFYYFDDLCNVVYADNEINLLKNVFDSENKKTLEEFEQILTCLIHEPKLLGVLNDLLVNVYDICKSIINSIVFGQYELNDLDYIWPKYSILRLAYHFNSKKESDMQYFFHHLNFEKIIHFTDNDKNSLNYLSFLLSERYFTELDVNSTYREQTQKIVYFLNENISKEDNITRRMINHLIEKIEKFNIDSISNALYNLKIYFTREGANERHSEIEKSLTTIATFVNSPKPSIEDVDSLTKLVKTLRFVIPALDEDIFNNLDFIKNKGISECYKKEYRLLFGEEGVYNHFHKILSLFKKMNTQKISELDIDGIMDISQKLIFFRFKHLLKIESNDFYIFSSNYLFQINECISRQISQLQKDYKKIKIKIDLFEKDEIVSMHKDFFSNALEEIVKNANKYSVNKKIDVEILITTVKNKNNEIEFQVFQNTDFNNDGIVGGTKSIIEPVFLTFGIPNSFKIEYSPNYIIKSKFKI